MYYANIKRGTQKGDHVVTSDKRLSLKARGLWFSLWWLSVADALEDEGQFSLASFVRDFSGDGIAATQKAFKELKTYGYIKEDAHKYGVRYYTLYERG